MNQKETEDHSSSVTEGGWGGVQKNTVHRERILLAEVWTRLREIPRDGEASRGWRLVSIPPRVRSQGKGRFLGSRRASFAAVGVVVRPDLSRAGLCS